MEQRTDVEPDAFAESETPLPPGDHSDLSVGEVLRRNRLFYEKSIHDVESVLRIRASYLEALERGEFHRLPGRVYAIGFVRSYAEYLGLDPDAMIRKFKAQAGGHSTKPEYTLPVPASESRVAGSWVLVSSAACAILVLSLWLMFSQTDRAIVPAIPAPEGIAIVPPPASGSGAIPSSAPESAPRPDPAVTRDVNVPASASPPIPDEKAAKKAAAIEPAAGLAVAPPGDEPLTLPRPAQDISFTPAAAPPAVSGEITEGPPDVIAPEGNASHRVLIRAIQSTWIEIRDPDGVVLLSSILKAGDMYFVPDRKGLVLSTGNAGGFEIDVDGKTIPRLGDIGDVRRGVPIDPDILVN
ncbi:MAG: helix-turn-helix domain-containing protein [Rhodospirillales bacterium]|nr:helix-turn-helix domain-containing protein [Rhodospirillales bacterium]